MLPDRQQRGSEVTDLSPPAIPPQPPESAWTFSADLRQPALTQLPWRERKARSDEVDLRSGVCLVKNFPDQTRNLDTAYNSLVHLLTLANISLAGGYPLRTEEMLQAQPESYTLTISEKECVLAASDAAGLRRGIYHLEDLFRQAAAPCLPLGVIERTAKIRTRIARCFFGPIKRPPKNRDELTDSVDYYPAEYLNRLAHDGVNGLWLTVRFQDLCPSKFFPNFGSDAPRRLEKLRRTVARCAEYGIAIYLFCIEPAAFPVSSKNLPEEFCGHRRGDSLTYFCTSSTTGQAYLEEATNVLFSAVPGLGGLLNITLGERPTNCYSALARFADCNCPRCAERTPAEVIAATISAMARGMHRANPDAELISWLYLPCVPEDAASQEALLQIAAQTPPNVTLQINFESGGHREQLGSPRLAEDYWLSYVGPSEFYEKMARAASANGARVAAKIQVGCSHEVATAPWVPVPGILYEKFKAMHALGVQTVMECWYFGSYPSVMTKAAGLLSFAPLPQSSEEFLLALARVEWGEHAPTVASAWRCFQAAYENYPLAKMFGYYGPMHDGAVWPLHLIPADTPLAPTWLLSFARSGDRIGECLSFSHTLAEAVCLSERVAAGWDEGVGLLRGILPAYKNEPDRQLDTGVACALGIQFRSGANILKFYLLREQLPYLAKNEQLAGLAELREIVQAEIKNSTALAEYAARDSRLGFHPEAEGYKYYVEKLAWREEILTALLRDEFPAVQTQIENGARLFPTYTGTQPPRGSYYGKKIAAGLMNDLSNPAVWTRLPSESCSWRSPALTAANETGKDAGDTPTWQACHDDETFYVAVRIGDWLLPGDTKICLEAKRLHCLQVFMYEANGECWLSRGDQHLPGNEGWDCQVEKTALGETRYFRIPLARLGSERNPTGHLRLNVSVTRRHSLSATTSAEAAASPVTYSWQELHPLPQRLCHGTDNAADLAWYVYLRR